MSRQELHKPVETIRIRVEHHANGQKKLEGQYRVLGHGTWRTWSQFGVLLEEVELFDGLRHGPYKRFDVSGRLMEEGRYVGGKRDGLWIEHAYYPIPIETFWDAGEKIWTRHGAGRQYEPGCGPSDSASLAGKTGPPPRIPR